MKIKESNDDDDGVINVVNDNGASANEIKVLI